MKKLAALSSIALSLLSPVKALAQDIKINAPSNIAGYTDLGAVIQKVLTFVFSLSILAVLIMLVWGGFEWITSGGEKEAVGKARGRIIAALVGLAVLAVAFALARVAGQFVGFENFTLKVPTPSSSP